MAIFCLFNFSRFLLALLFVASGFAVIPAHAANGVARPATPSSANPAPPHSPNVGARPVPARRLNSDEDLLGPLPTKFQYSVGYEGATTSTSVLGQNAVAVGTWLNGDFGFEAYLGYTRNADTYTETTGSVTDALSRAQTNTTAYSGSKNRSAFIIGGVIKYRVYQNNWFQFYAGGLLLFSPSRSSDYTTGTRTESIADTNNSGNKSILENGLGNVTSQTSAAFSIGPKLGTEFYLPWFPHLGIGFATGILATFGGNTTTTTSARSRTYTVVSGVDQAASFDSSNTSVAYNSVGDRYTTFGIGGTAFQFTGIFTIRYVW